jgi:hypothetical protein
MHSADLEHIAAIALRLYLLEHSDVGELGDCESKKPGIHSDELGLLLPSNKADSVL